MCLILHYCHFASILLSLRATRKIPLQLKKESWLPPDKFTSAPSPFLFQPANRFHSSSFKKLLTPDKDTPAIKMHNVSPQQISIKKTSSL